MAFRGLQNISQYLPAPWILVGLLVAFFLIFSLRSNKETVLSGDISDKTFPQVFMNNVETREFDQQGKLHYQLATPNIAHYQLSPDVPGVGDYTLIESPQITFYDRNGAAPWQVTAARGRSEDNSQLIRLLENVLIQQQSPQQGLFQISTTELSIRPREQSAETDKAVKMQNARSKVDAVGMSADLANSQVQLKSQVKAVYEPR